MCPFFIVYTFNSLRHLADQPVMPHMLQVLAGIREEFDRVHDSVNIDDGFDGHPEYGTLHAQIESDREHRMPFVSARTTGHSSDESVSRVHASARMPSFSHYSVPPDTETPRAIPSRTRALEVILETMQALHFPPHLGGIRSHGLARPNKMRYRGGHKFGKWLKALAVFYRKSIWDGLVASEEANGAMGEGEIDTGDNGFVKNLLTLVRERSTYYNKENSASDDESVHLFVAPVVWVTIAMYVARVQYGILGDNTPATREIASYTPDTIDKTVVDACVAAVKRLGSTHEVIEVSTQESKYNVMRPKSFDSDSGGTDSHTARATFMFAKEMAIAHTRAQIQIKRDQEYDKVESLFINADYDSTTSEHESHVLYHRAVSWNLVGIYDITYAAMASGTLDAVVSWEYIKVVTAPLDDLAEQWKALDVTTSTITSQDKPKKGEWVLQVHNLTQQLNARVILYITEVFGPNAVDISLTDVLHDNDKNGVNQWTKRTMDKLHEFVFKFVPDIARADSIMEQMGPKINSAIHQGGVYLSGTNEPHPIDVAAFTALIIAAVNTTMTADERSKIEKGTLFRAIQDISDPTFRSCTGGGDRMTLSALHTATRHLNKLYHATKGAPFTEAMVTHAHWVFDTLARDSNFVYAIRHAAEANILGYCYLHNIPIPTTAIPRLVQYSIQPLVRLFPTVVDGAGQQIEWTCRTKLAADTQCFDYFPVTEVHIKGGVGMGTIFPELGTDGAVLAKTTTGGMGFRIGNQGTVHPFRMFGNPIIRAVPGMRSDSSKYKHGWYITGVLTLDGFRAASNVWEDNGQTTADSKQPCDSDCVLELTRAHPGTAPLIRRTWSCAVDGGVRPPTQPDDAHVADRHPDDTASTHNSIIKRILNVPKFIKRSVNRFCNKQMVSSVDTDSTAVGVLPTGIWFCRIAMMHAFNTFKSGEQTKGSIRLHGGAAIVYHLSRAMEENKTTDLVAWTTAAVMYPLVTSRMMDSQGYESLQPVRFFDIDIEYIEDGSVDDVGVSISTITAGVIAKMRGTMSTEGRDWTEGGELGVNCLASLHDIQVPAGVKESVCGVEVCINIRSRGDPDSSYESSDLSDSDSADGELFSLPHKAKLMDIAWSNLVEDRKPEDTETVPVSLTGWAAELQRVAAKSGNDATKTVLSKVHAALVTDIPEYTDSYAIPMQTLQAANTEIYEYWVGVCNAASLEGGVKGIRYYARSRHMRYQRDITTLMAIMSTQDAIAAMAGVDGYTPQRGKFESLLSRLRRHKFDVGAIHNVSWVPFHETVKRREGGRK